jgi:hypothetical protein
MLLSGCVPHARPPEPTPLLQSRWLPYLEDGRTTKEEVLLKLGIPSAQFEGERILTYRLALNDETGFMTVPRELDPEDRDVSRWVNAQYSLVLVFDAQRVLQRHSLLKVR